MRFKDEIDRAVKHQASNDESMPRKTKDELAVIVENVISSISTTAYDFTHSDVIILKQDKGKRRLVKRFPDVYSSESVLCQCIKQLLDKTFRIKYPNRNKSVRALFDALKAVTQMNDFTIIKYDFRDYFNTVSVPYAFAKYIKPKLTDRFVSDLIQNFAEQTQFAYAGFNTSNVVAEIVAQHFDNAIQLSFAEKGVLFFERYIDDSLLIINEHIEEVDCLRIIQSCLSEVFHDSQIDVKPKCRTQLNQAKLVHITRRKLIGHLNAPFTVDYLGYQFFLKCIPNNQIELKYGITVDKRRKYCKRIDRIIRLYREPMIEGCSNDDYGKMELLRHRITAFTSRVVYQSGCYGQIVWKAKGIIVNYGELRYLLGSGLVDRDTERFLKDMVTDAFKRAGFTKLPYFLKGSSNRVGHNLFYNMKKNKTLLLVENIGYSKNALEQLCKQVCVGLTDCNGNTRGYGNLVRDYLIKLKVGY